MPSEREKMLSGELYDAGDPQLVAERERACELTREYNRTTEAEPEERAAGLEYGEPVSVGDDVWIGGRAVLNLNVTVGDGSVISSGAVVTEDVPAGVVAGGNPARVLGQLD